MVKLGLRRGGMKDGCPESCEKERVKIANPRTEKRWQGRRREVEVLRYEKVEWTNWRSGMKITVMGMNRWVPYKYGLHQRNA